MDNINWNEFPTWVLILLVIINIFKAQLVNLIPRGTKTEDDIVDLLKNQIAFSNSLYGDLKDSIDKNAQALQTMTLAIELVLKELKEIKVSK